MKELKSCSTCKFKDVEKGCYPCDECSLNTHAIINWEFNGKKENQ